MARRGGVPDPVQLAISTIGFVFRVCALGWDTVTSLPLFNAVVVGLLLIAWVFSIPLIDGWPEKW
jgi:hypothetical protein